MFDVLLEMLKFLVAAAVWIAAMTFGIASNDMGYEKARELAEEPFTLCVGRAENYPTGILICDAYYQFEQYFENSEETETETVPVLQDHGQFILSDRFLSLLACDWDEQTVTLINGTTEALSTDGYELEKGYETIERDGDGFSIPSSYIVSPGHELVLDQEEIGSYSHPDFDYDSKWHLAYRGFPIPGTAYCLPSD